MINRKSPGELDRVEEGRKHEADIMEGHWETLAKLKHSHRVEPIPQNVAQAAREHQPTTLGVTQDGDNFIVFPQVDLSQTARVGLFPCAFSRVGREARVEVVQSAGEVDRERDES